MTGILRALGFGLATAGLLFLLIGSMFGLIVLGNWLGLPKDGAILAGIFTWITLFASGIWYMEDKI